MASTTNTDSDNNTIESDVIMDQDSFHVLAIALPTEVERRQHLAKMMDELGITYSLAETSPPRGTGKLARRGL